MHRDTFAAKTFGRPRIALDPVSLSTLDIRRPGEAKPVKPDGFGNVAVTAMAQEAYNQTECLLGIWSELSRIADALAALAGAAPPKETE